MDMWRIVFGFFVSMFVGAFFLWLIINKGLWPYISKKHIIQGGKSGSLTMMVGIIERASYTAALILGVPEWIAVWLAMKVAVGWREQQKRESPSDNLYLIGNILSIMFGVIGAWIAIGQLPCLKK
ncbi:MAG: hypothetical protein IVZ94_08010 [Nitrospirae bacterium]|nr:hypothetical protein [Nitrospirota bacterium]